MADEWIPAVPPQYIPKKFIWIAPDSLSDVTALCGSAPFCYLTFEIDGWTTHFRTSVCSLQRSPKWTLESVIFPYIEKKLITVSLWNEGAARIPQRIAVGSIESMALSENVVSDVQMELFPVDAMSRSSAICFRYRAGVYICRPDWLYAHITLLGTTSNSYPGEEYYIVVSAAEASGTLILPEDMVFASGSNNNKKSLDIKTRLNSNINNKESNEFPKKIVLFKSMSK